MNLAEPLTNNHVDPESIADMFQLSEMYAPNQKTSPSVLKLQNEFKGVQGLIQILNSSPSEGITGTPNDISERQNRFGTNRKIPKKSKKICEMIKESFEDTILRILCVAAVVSLVIGIVQDGWLLGSADGGSIILAIIIIVSVTVGNNMVKERQFQELADKSDLATAIVTRGGQIITIDAEELVVGDIITFELGKTVPADCVLISASDLSCNEGLLTGEPEAIKKHQVTEQNLNQNPCPFIFKSTLVETGTGRALVAVVGTRTQIGKVEQLLDIEDEMTPLQAKLETIANQIGLFGVGVALLTFLALVIRGWIHIAKNDLPFWSNAIRGVMNAFILGVTIVVVAVPEGLPLAVTISLAYSVGKMFKENNLVRRLDASETMGGANEICTDKTGTLTQNKMTVMTLFAENKIFTTEKVETLQSYQLLQECVAYNCSAYVEKLENGQKVAKGNVTEVGLLNYFTKQGADVEAYLQNKTQNGFFEFVIPFSSSRKRATTAVRNPRTKQVSVFVKGAPEIVIDLCDRYIGENGEEEDLDQEKKDEIISKIVKTMAGKCYRTILVAHADFTENEWSRSKANSNDFLTEQDRETVESGLCLCGIFGLQDPLRPGIRAAVEQCHVSGINVRMVTGDNIDTAIAISKEAGIITDDFSNNEEGYVCMTGKQFREAIGGLVTRMNVEKKIEEDYIANQDVFDKITKHLKVLARSSPEDKYLLVTGLKFQGQVVAVTGDGTNDAPALAKADVGFSMGISGTDVAKSACDIVLTDDNFCSVLTAVRYGRNIYDNVRKFLQFQLTVNVVALFIVFAGSVIFADPPLTSVQMLWVNLIMDTFAALALATEPPSDKLLNRPPQSRNENIVSPLMWRNVLGQSVYQIGWLMMLLFSGKQMFNLPYDSNTPFYQLDAQGKATIATNKTVVYTIIFQTFVFMQIFNQINSRKLTNQINVFEGFFNNSLFIGIMIFTFVIQMVLVEFGGIAVRCAPLNWEQNGICFGIGFGGLLWSALIKIVINPKYFQGVNIDEEPQTDLAAQKSLVGVIRKQTTARRLTEDQKSLRQNTLIKSQETLIRQRSSVKYILNPSKEIDSADSGQVQRRLTNKQSQPAKINSTDDRVSEDKLIRGNKPSELIEEDE